MSLTPRRRIFTRVERGPVRLPGLLLVLAGVAALGMVWWVQDGLGIMPCALCLWERWPWRIVLGLGVLSLLVPRRWARSVAWMGIPPLIADLALCVIHAGVEWKFWPSPLPECMGPHLQGQTMAERLASMPLRPGKPCDTPTYLFDWLPVSLTVMEGLAAVVVLTLLLGLLLRADGGRTAG
ncbi:disulfide bond formation protein B [Acetobacter estunensis]|uniref:disulfide bond formation protein B n=1 Tax=Acetobacter estunensis TaxID=104097 RepID=UPI001C2D6E50|nr:disulfide bond formation protein B [Acetobacter estunensis]MBV1837455.1 disulfide bond formation protein B [Acetobacter estunensis]